MTTDGLRNALVRDLVLRLQRGSYDEARVIDRVLRRLERRRAKVGALDLRARPNVFAELDEGLIDAVIACTIEAIRCEDEAHAAEQAKAADEMAELRRWQHADQRTIVSSASHRIALDDIAEPYEEFDDGEAG